MTEVSTHKEQTKVMLHELGFPSHYSGYRKLCIAIPRYAQDPEQNLAKEVYPFVTQELGCSGDIESSIRRTIAWAWEHGNRSTWEKYFPGFTKAPQNLIFISTLAEHLN